MLVGRVLLPSTDIGALAGAALLTGTGWSATAYSLGVLLAIALCGLHRLGICLRAADQMPRMAVAALLPAPLLAPWSATAGRLVLQPVVAVIMLAAARCACYACLRSARRHGLVMRPALIVGTGALAAEIARLLAEHAELGLRPVGFLAGAQAGAGREVPLLGTVADLVAVSSRYRACCVIVGFPADTDADLVSALRAKPPLSAEVYLVPRLYEVAASVPSASLDEIWGIPLVRLRNREVRYGLAAKRAVDVSVGSFLLVLLAPLLVIVVSAAWLLDGRPVLFRQTRLTRDGKLIKITKLRTVAGGAPDTQWTPTATTSWLHHWLRATHLDELPQLVHVIRGDMSLVGPRPERPFFAMQFARLIPRYDDRHRVRGGMTGWAQVHGLTGDTSISDRTRFDNYYIEHQSAWLDLVILIRTLASPFAGVRRERAARQQVADAGAAPVAEAEPES